MSIVLIHGIGKQLDGAVTLHARLFPALSQGLRFAGREIGSDAVTVAAYGDVFRPEAEVLAPEIHYDADDVEQGYEQDFLRVLWERAAEVDEGVVPPDEETLFRSPAWVQRALYALSMSRFWSGLGERAFISDLKQVRRYFTDDDVRATAHAALAAAVSDGTRVIVAHSLGSVVAYEALCAHPEWSVRALVTLGSPLGLRHLVYNRLRPAPEEGPDGFRARWPGSVRTWTNIVDAGDVIAVVEDIRPFFSDRITQIRVHNGSRAHDMRSYLTDQATGRAIAAGLSG
ncbi:hypothetical protein LUW76_25115 [Actinomadura madurae]|uniref:hypothetical protein n=1 Tax=Actinomadura madurae TaxID=1993 RepID=UPI002026776A|nr:hypothetical protein [Actinomadura madurae]URM97368.1 hypothetical protein LUW76_25115 [Actinomadura madurae]URN07634.1 hypothetical protein LUW74_32615 [Actinomadura madurae]